MICNSLGSEETNAILDTTVNRAHGINDALHHVDFFLVAAGVQVPDGCWHLRISRSRVDVRGNTLGVQGAAVK